MVLVLPHITIEIGDSLTDSHLGGLWTVVTILGRSYWVCNKLDDKEHKQHRYPSGCGLIMASEVDGGRFILVPAASNQIDGWF